MIQIFHFISFETNKIITEDVWSKTTTIEAVN
jgi:hypothetical protein